MCLKVKGGGGGGGGGVGLRKIVVGKNARGKQGM